MITTYASDVPGYCRCYRCGGLLFNPDAPVELSPARLDQWGTRQLSAQPLTVDRIIPGVFGGTYKRNNIRPACGGCNSETGGALSGKGGKK